MIGAVARNVQRTLGVLLLTLPACRRAPTAAPRPAPSAPPPVVAADVPRVSLTQDAGADAARTVARATRVASVRPSGDTLDALVSLGDGVLHVRAINHDGERASDIVATSLDADGRPRGPARVLRRTTGPVRALDASAAGGALWVAWAAVRAEGDDGARAEFIFAAVRGSTDLATVERPVTVDDFRAALGDEYDMAPQAIARARIGVVAADDGGAVIVASAPVQTCVHEGGTDHASRVACRGWSVTTVTADGQRSRSVEGRIAMTDGPYGLLRIPNGFVYGVDNDHIGSKASAVVEALARGAAPPFHGDTYWHYRDLAFAAAGGALYARGTPTEEGMRASRFGHIAALDPAHAARTPTREGDWGTEWPPLTLRALRCERGHPVLALGWEGGSVRLDPTVAGSSFRWDEWLDPADLPLPARDGGASEGMFPVAWSGRALVGVIDGMVVRWRCGARGSIEVAP